MSENSITELLDRLERLEAERLIERTLYAYGTALDYGDRTMFLDCFTDDASYVVTMRTTGQVVLEFHGQEELAGYFDGHGHAPENWHKHITTNISLEVDGDEATGLSYFLRVDAGHEAGPGTILGSGRYLDTYARVAGSWRIRTRLCEVENL